MTASNKPGRSGRSRRGSRRPDSTRPRQASRLERPPSSSVGSTTIRLSPPTFVDLSPEEERHAIEALAELLVPWLTGPLNGFSDMETPDAVAPTLREG